MALIVTMAGSSVLPGQAAAAPQVLYRVNAGGPSLSGTPEWSADTTSTPSPFVNALASGNDTFATTTPIDLSDPSVPAGTPEALFQTERWDSAAAPDLEWDFPVTSGLYEVRLFFADIYPGTQSIGAREFDVSIEGALVLDNFDVYAAVGGYKGLVKTFEVTSNANLDIDFAHAVENPAIKAIEIIEPGPNHLAASPGSLDLGTVVVNGSQSQSVQLINQGAAGDPSIIVDATSISGANASEFQDSFDDASDVTLAPGASTTISATFTPTSVGSKAATLNVAHSGTNTPLAIPLTGTGSSSVPIGFGKSVLSFESSDAPTSLQFGPDGRLYVAQLDGVIKIYTVVRLGPNDYSVTATETITSVQSIPNHDDSGGLNPSVNTRIVTGILVAGTAADPIIYATSSDPRIGAGPSGQDSDLDTNSSMVSRLTWNGSSWQKLDLVRGLPRSEENHSANGLQLDSATNTLYVSQGGNTNKGAPSNNFALLSEFALSTAILKIDLTAIGNTTYDLPTLDDDSRAGTVDADDPFGGNDGKNQAMLVPGGPVQVYAPGFRNPYDLLITQAGRMYTIDNGGNAGWGDIPVDEGPGGTCTNQVNEPGTTDQDTLHFISGAGYYGGHPNPTRGNTANTFNANPAQSPVASANPVECDYRAPGPERGDITSFPASTNGLAEYTASNFGGAMAGDLLAASFENKIHRVKLNAAGDGLVLEQALFSAVGNVPLDVTAEGDGQIFPGTIWVADHGSGAITAFEPNDFGGGGGPCTGVNNPALDEDGDGFDNADEIANGTNPCSAADVPPDWDGDKESNLLDPDDDNDGQPDTSDPFAIDAQNGTTTTLPVSYTWNNGAPNPGGLLNLGFTGLMTNGTSNYESLFDAAAMTAGGAAGVTTVDVVSEGDALAGINAQEYGFQFGVDAPAERFTARTRILAPFAGLTPQDDQSMGLFLGTGDQDNYAKIVTSANGGAGGVQFVKEVGGATSGRPQAAVAMPGADAVDLYLTVDPDAGTVQPSYAVTTGGVTGARVDLGGPEPIPAGWFGGSAALAVGMISTSHGPGPEFPATWDFMDVRSDPPYAHPQSAPAISVPLVPVFRACGLAATGSHAPPLSAASCIPPQRLPGAAAHVAADSQGSVTLTAIAGDNNPTNGDQADIAISVYLDDVTTVTGGDYDPNASGADLTEVTRIRLTDRNNSGGASATTTDFDFSTPVNCVPHGGPKGSTCESSTSADAIMPGAIPEGRRTVAQVFRVRLYDSGLDGVRENGAGDDVLFVQQGVFVP